jgi:hypothetical protein
MTTNIDQILDNPDLSPSQKLELLKPLWKEDLPDDSLGRLLASNSLTDFWLWQKGQSIRFAFGLTFDIDLIALVNIPTCSFDAYLTKQHTAWLNLFKFSGHIGIPFGSISFVDHLQDSIEFRFYYSLEPPPPPAVSAPQQMNACVLP